MADGTTTIDDLQIEIGAKAQTANDAIDRLVTKLDRLQTSLSKVNGSQLTGLANGVDRLGKSMQVMNTIKTADFTRLATNLTKLGSINVSALNSSASSLSHLSRAFNTLGTVSQNTQSVVNMANSLSSLGGARVQRAITNIPLLATAMNNLMVTLSRSPRVSNNVIQLTNALANLTSQGAKVGSASRSIEKGLNRANNSATRTSKSFGGLASAIGKFYATYFLVIRGIKGLYKSIESTADYLEAFNYFNVALGKIGSDWSHQFEQYGYESAEAYADSFSTRLQSSLKNLSGLQITLDADGNGLLTETGLKNLGLNIQEITQYASQLASVTNSVGQVGEVSLAAANSLTKLGADLSSLFNLDYSSVMQNLQSGLIGQSRALYKYGIDITNATLQTYAYELGLEKAVSEMTQAEKMQLRVIAILDQSKVSWGDLANTINSPSNMIRQFKNNLKEVGMVLGQLFIPLMQKVMPVINGVTIALKRLLVSIAGFLGIQLDLSSFGQGYSNMGEDVDGLTDSLDDATASAKKLKTVTLGIDELNINAPQDQSGSSTGGVGGGIDLTDEILKATEEYEKVWNDAFSKMENKAQEWANRIEKIFEPLAKPLKDLFKSISIGDWFGAGQNVSNIVSGIFDLFSKAIKKVDWNKLGKNIGKFLAGIDWANILKSAFRAIGDILQGILEGYFGSLSVAPLETITLSLFSLSRMNFGKLKGLKDAINNLTKLQKVGIGAVTVFSEFKLLEDGFKNIALGSDNFASSLTQVATSAVSASAILFKLFGPAGFLISGITTAVSLLVGFGKAEQEIVERNAGEAIRNALTVPGGMKLEDINQKYSELISNVSNGFVRINDSSANMESTRANIESVWTEIEKIKTQMDAGVISVSDGTAELKRLFEELSNITNTYIGDIENSLILAFGDNGAFSKYADDLGLNITDALVGAFNITGDMKERVSELALLMSDPNISTEQYIAYQSELASILGKTDELEVALNNFSKNVSAIDLSELFDEKGTLNVDVFKSKLNELSDTVKSANKEIDLAGESIKGYLNTLMEQADTEEEKLAVQQLFDLVNLSIEEAKKDVELQANEYGKTIQTALIENTNNIIKKGLEDGESAIDIKSFAGIYLNGVKKATDLINDELETANLSTDIFDTLMDELFYFDTVKVDGYIVSDSNVETVVADNYTDIIQNAIDGTLNNTQDDFVNAGKFSTENYAHGLELGKSPIVAKANLISNSAITPFNSVSNTMKNVGFNTIGNFTNGMNESATSLYSKCNEIVENMKNIFKGVNLGINIGANAIISNVNIPQYAVGGFPEDGLFMANRNELVGQFTNGRTAVANNEQIVEGIKYGVREAVSEILAPYLADIARNTRETADKDMSVNIGDREIARANARGQRSLGYALIT